MWAGAGWTRCTRQREQLVERPGNQRGRDVVTKTQTEVQKGLACLEEGLAGGKLEGGPLGICTRTSCSGFGLYLKKNRKLSKVVSRGRTRSHLHVEKIALAAAGVLNWKWTREAVGRLVEWLLV